ncbi:autotransporter outer membrane beta-barrel domain-containing protein [Pseudomonas sp. UMAB-08]|uniref:autotransporter family protein n=1 Tax=Pseudomonas sp. UMAB-08 TaxID=1365375 RepID=UPI001C57A43B
MIYSFAYVGSLPAFRFVMPALLLMCLSVQARAACTLVTTPGNDTFTCDSGNSGPLTDLQGSNTLIFPALGTGTVNGAVTFGPGLDRIVMNSGSIVGTVDQGDGANSFEINLGTVSGAVRQGSVIDSFIMNGGTIQSLAQGDGRDTFLMTGGTITGAFEDGDVAKMTGGTIGRVDMKLDNNIFDMSGGRIVGNLVTGFGKDTIIVSGGTIGGNISVSGGDDSITISGGEVTGEIRASFGNDTFIWSGGGIIHSAVLMAEGNDTAILRTLNEATLSTTPNIDGGPGIDVLTLDATSSSTPARYTRWETVNLDNGSRVDLAGDFILGDADTGTGVFNVDSSSAVTSVAGSIRPFTSGQLATLNNAGTLDMTTGSNSASDTLTVHGNYVGNNGQLWVQSVLADDASPSDRLVVDRGTLSGTTQISVSNLGGVGGLTQQNGIQVVNATNGATSDNSAFSLKNSVSAGAYQYYLFKGGVTAGSENSWYLRSAVVALPSPVEQPVSPTTAQPAAVAPVAAIGTPALPVAIAGASPIPLYRLEVPNYAVVTPAAAVLTLAALGTFHDRQGEQSLLRETGAVPAGWGRVYGRDFKQSWAGTVAPGLDATLSGYQVGHDLYAMQTRDGHVQRLGVFIGHSQLNGQVDGFAEGFHDRRTGTLRIEGDSLGAYWTLTDAKGWYLDAVAMGTRLDGYSRSDRGIKIDTEGHALSLSLEAGYPIPVSEHWVIEPQAQLINQHIYLDSQNDGISDVSFDSQAYTSGRVGARIKGRYSLLGMPVEPYVRGNLWRNFGGSDSVIFDHADTIKTQHRSTSADVGVGVVAKVASDVSFYLSADYSSNLDSHSLNGMAGNMGVRISW